jgi:hypothetical protein
MKRSLAKILVAAVVFVVTLLVGGIVSKKTKASDGYLFNTGEISEGSVLIIYFHPECEHCQYEISSLVKSNIPESGVKILLISDAGSQQIKSFLEQFDIKNDRMYKVLYDTAFVFRRIFGVEIIPSHFIYNEALKLVKSLKGETRIETIEKYLKSDDQH